jgi:hypothetical protein
MIQSSNIYTDGNKYLIAEDIKTREKPSQVKPGQNLTEALNMNL